MSLEPLVIQGVAVPRFLYGTAWKEEATQSLSELAIRQGFRGIDTANQRRHYYEAGVGCALAELIQQGVVCRTDLFLQTKFTFAAGQDHRLPYDPRAAVAGQVQQSLTSSLEHLQTTFVDSLVLHGPATRNGLVAADREAWRAMESLHAQGKTRLLGISNVSIDQLQALIREARIPPHFVQNRCFAVLGWDREIREFCRERDIVYQGFSLLTANQVLLRSPFMTQMAARYRRTIPQIVFRFAIDAGMIPLTGTSRVEHMQQDLAIHDFRLAAEDLRAIESIAER